MNIEKLSKRLETVTSFIQSGMRIADIGSDHAYLPCYAVKNGIAKSAIAGEVVEGPYQSALQQVRKSELTKKIDVRKGDGLAVISPSEVDCIIIAGMGGALITDILERGKEKLDGVKRLILQPNIGAESIRKWLYDHGWQLVDEKIVEEDGKFYEILVADIGSPSIPYKDFKKELLLGPFLLKNKNEAFIKKWQLELKQWKNILKELDKAEDSNKITSKKEEIMNKIDIVMEELK
ncbi:tRNA (adenine(22)-N(1))-methyltransferase TrmK [Lederbergia wuyishanensis]|uniref:tRNA (Adenine22-N1)-methyltransferase n=1 Tax=Lederbergia wuyishanensis TaxID=1347903 RepID=A0ABU0D1H9_9BACI|nr:tRNA (adenine(22)-N(1))-methyltransferase TrmK [Lederbergia wuyishanensis]MCJ8006853.1 tRNA (adenine(22)-N(1))-methyltransferase TrmK [Lederbergia wuyishanensis]MDQ0342237.1 tRNA (adenine22-N1)-methyltransferase [Lederbergia wuyishanensis]